MTRNRTRAYAQGPSGTSGLNLSGNMVGTFLFQPSTQCIGTPPPAWIYGWNVTAPAGNMCLSGARAMGILPDTSELPTASVAQTGVSYGGQAQFISAPLAAQTIPLNAFMGVGCGAKFSVGAGTSGVYACIYLIKSDGTLRLTLPVFNIHTSGFSGGTEYSFWQEQSIGTSFAVTAGDRLMVEVGIATSSTSTTTAYSGGTVSPFTVANFAALSNVQSGLFMSPGVIMQ